MELKLDELRLVTEFRALSPEGQQELLDYAVLLGKKDRQQAEEAPDVTGGDQCALKRPEGRPEAAAEPIFTE